MAGIKERMIQYVLRAQDMLSPAANKGREALDELRTAGEKVRAELDKATDDNKLVKSLVGVAKDSERTEKSVERVNKRIESLQAELEKNPDSKGLVTSLRAAEKEAENANKALAVLKQEAAEYAEKAKAAGIDTSKLSDEEKRLAAELVKAKAAVTDNSKATKDLQKEQAAAARAAAEQKAETGKLGEVMNAAGKRVLVFAAAYISLKTAMSAVKSVTNFVLDGFKSVFSGASEAEQVLGQLNAALSSTGNAIGLTAEQLQKMGLEMRKSSMLSVEQITEMQTALLTYTDIAADEFPRALQVAIDQQQRLGISITRSAELVGMALQDPSKAMVALGRQGFKLEEGQKQLLKQMEDTGRTAEAQAIIMDMLAESYGGSASAAKFGTFKGIWKGITDTFSDFQSKIADAGAFDLIKDKLQSFSERLVELEQDGTLENLAKAISNAFVEGANKVEEFVTKLGTIDFKTIADDSSRWLGDFESKITSSINAVVKLTAPVRVLANVFTGFGAAALTAFSGVVFGALSLMSVLAKAIPDMFGGDKIVAGLESARDSVAGMMTGLAGQVATDFNDIKGAVNDLMGSTTDAVVGAEEAQLAAVKKSYSEKKISAEEYLETLNKIKAEKLALIEISESESTAAQQQLAELYNTSNQLAQMHADGLISTEAHAASQANLQIAIDQVKAKVDETKGSFESYSNQLKDVQASIDATSQKEQEALETKAQRIQALREEQKRLSEEFFAGNITQQAWEQGHNTANAAIMELNKTVEEAAVKIDSLQEAEAAFTTASTVAELQAFQKALFDAYSEKNLDLENFQRLHNKASEEIKKLGGAGVQAGKDLTTLSGVMKAIGKAVNDLDIRQAKAALDKLYKESKINAEQHKKAQEELNKKVAELKPAADKSKKAVDEMGEALDSSGANMERARDHANKTSASFEWFMGTINAVREPLEQMSGAAKDAFNELQGIKTAPELDLSSVEGATEALQRAREETGKLEEAMAKTFGGNISDTLSRWATQTKLNGKEVEMNFIAQKIQMQKLIESYNSGAISAAAFAKAAAGARGQFNLLDDSDLSALEGAVDAAKQKMDQLADSTKSTLQSLNDELLQLQGTQEEIEKSKMDSRRRDLQSQLADARKDGDDRAVRNLQQALSTLSEIESERERAARNKKAEDAKAEADKTATAKAPVTQKQEPTKVIKLQLGGQSVDVGVGSAGDEAALLSILEQAGLRSL